LFATKKEIISPAARCLRPALFAGLAPIRYVAINIHYFLKGETDEKHF
jgi:hypothetical protein